MEKKQNNSLFCGCEVVATENIVTGNHFCSGMDLSAWNLPERR